MRSAFAIASLLRMFFSGRQMVSKYGKDKCVTGMLDKMDFIIMPVLNVDGYVYTWKGVSFSCCSSYQYTGSASHSCISNSKKSHDKSHDRSHDKSHDRSHDRSHDKSHDRFLF